MEIREQIKKISLGVIIEDKYIGIDGEDTNKIFDESILKKYTRHYGDYIVFNKESMGFDIFTKAEIGELEKIEKIIKYTMTMKEIQILYIRNLDVFKSEHRLLTEKVYISLTNEGKNVNKLLQLYRDLGINL